MVINWYGESCFKLQTGETAILTDPFDAKTGLTPPRLKADIVLKTRIALPLPYIPEREGAVISGPGEYEIRGIEFFGLPLKGMLGEKTLESAYLVTAEELRLGFLGHASDMPDAEILERMGDVDVLFIPAGGAPYLSQELAAKLVKQINPKIVVASLFKVPKLARKSDAVDAFLKELDQKAEPQEKLVIKKKDLPASLQVFIPKI